MRDLVISFYNEMTGIEMDIDYFLSFNLSDLDKCEFIVKSESEFTIEGRESSVLEILERIKKHFEIETSVMSEGSMKISLKELFMKSAYNCNLGTEFKTVKINLKLLKSI